jgi:hypothetical protein
LDPAGKAGRYNPLVTYLGVAAKNAALEGGSYGISLIPFAGKESSRTARVFDRQTLLDLWTASKQTLLRRVGR